LSLRVALVSEHASPLAVVGGVDAGGQNVHVAALAKALARKGAEVTVHTRRDNPILRDRISLYPGVEVILVPAGPPEQLPKDRLLPLMSDFTTHLGRDWRMRPPDIVHAHFWMSGLAALGAARPLGIPVVQTFHALGVVKKRNQGAKDTSPAERLNIERWIIQNADRILATSSDEVFELARLGAPARRMSIIPCGVDLSLFTAYGRRAARTHRHRILMVSRLVERKGIGNAISAMSELPSAELLVVGGPRAEQVDSDPLVAGYRRLAHDLGVGERVTFLGSLDHDDVPKLIRSADVVACVPWYEPFGMVALESMACGIPVVATAVGGLVDTVVDGKTGLHVPPRNPTAIARAISRLLGDPLLRARLGRAGAHRAEARYGWQRIAQLTVDAYTAVFEDSRLRDQARR
jgi:glycosyltransferase involved in cell wall biosynthesis